MKKTILLAIMLMLLSEGRAFTRETGYDKPGFDEKRGGAIPLDLTFTSEDNGKVTLRELMDRPVCLVLVYYDCSHLCPQMLAGLAKSLAGLQLAPGKDYRMITLSFDDTEGPREAKAQKRNYIKAMGRPFPDDAWRFLTGERENISRLSDAVGVRFKKTEHGFIHPEVLIFVSPKGVITKYMHLPEFNYGVADPMVFSGAGLKNAFLDASAGRVSTGEDVTPMYCFPEEPSKQEKFFNMLKVSGTLTVLALFFLFVYLKGQTKSA